MLEPRITQDEFEAWVTQHDAEVTELFRTQFEEGVEQLLRNAEIRRVVGSDGVERAELHGVRDELWSQALGAFEMTLNLLIARAWAEAGDA